ncbi:hypothetical protein DFP72DRAFT_1072617 [Ephemerocybe angulata]|uniref:Uncharacterized protein n=1 Tax=Ephemerocybe angulata TaxID=980116 RepID=A0A8H6M3A4_9AGAR|nr:hypothetical protein DFP72DRAFT_1072617 [Tulosesus angulatus]
MDPTLPYTPKPSTPASHTDAPKAYPPEPTTHHTATALQSPKLDSIQTSTIAKFTMAGTLRFCEAQKESVVHVWMVCSANEALVQARRAYILNVLMRATPGEAAYIRSLHSVPSQQLRALLDLRSLTSATAEYAYVVQEIAEGVGLAPVGN